MQEKTKEKIITLNNLEDLWLDCKKHWENTWLPDREFFQDKTCVDIGMWKGLLNARAKKEFNLATNIGVEPDEMHRLACKKLNLSTTLYANIEDLPDMIKTDIVLLHGVFSVMGKHWRQELENLFSKINCKHVHIRLNGYSSRHIRPTGTGRQTSRYALTSYKDTATSDMVIDFLSKKGFDLLEQRTLSEKYIILKLQKKIYEN